MFGRQRHGEDPPNAEAEVEVHLETDIDAVQQAVATFLQVGGEGSRQALLATLETLDNQIDRSDAYEASIVGSPVFGGASKGSVLGETSTYPLAEEVPDRVVRSQVALVRAAKNVIRDPSPHTLHELRSASDSLTEAQAGGSPEGSSTDTQG
jgi:hypothetical protein